MVSLTSCLSSHPHSLPSTTTPPSPEPRRSSRPSERLATRPPFATSDHLRPAGRTARPAHEASARTRPGTPRAPHREPPPGVLPLSPPSPPERHPHEYGVPLAARPLGQSDRLGSAHRRRRDHRAVRGGESLRCRAPRDQLLPRGPDRSDHL